MWEGYGLIDRIDGGKEWMRNPVSALVGTPENHEQEKEDHKVVEAPEFDLTQYAKKVVVTIPLIAGACLGALELWKGTVTEVLGVAVFGVVAASVIGSGLVMAADLMGRAYVTAAGGGENKEGEKADDPAPLASSLVAAPPGTLIWLEDASGPYPVLAFATDGKGSSSYLVADGSSFPRPQGGKSVEAINGAPKWHPGDKVEAVKPAKWP